jgi:hypothetical protein
MGIAGVQGAAMRHDTGYFRDSKSQADPRRMLHVLMPNIE